MDNHDTTHFGDLPTKNLSQSDDCNAQHGPPAPEHIGRYEIRSVLGQGTFGIVYKGWDSSLRRDVAVKLLRAYDKCVDFDKWLVESQTVAALDHPAIVPVYDVGQSDTGRPYMVSKFIEGGSLATRIAKDRLDVIVATKIIMRIAEALDYAHYQKIVHRDVKPGNILITATGEAVLADFGLAMHESRFGSGAHFVGTPAYMSPEQARHEGHRVDGRSDIYSLGVVMYQLLAGVRPFRAETNDELLECVRNVEVRPPRQIDRDVPRELERICIKSLAKRAADRYTTAGDVADELRRWLAEQSVAESKPEHDSTQGSAKDPPGSQKITEVAVVPRGLRPFGATDADFFMHLLPGPRDREGLTESVRFWKTHIDETQGDATFRVGVLLGASGSGKSSLIRAGIEPSLDPSVVVLRQEARPDGLEQQLLRRLRGMIPEIKSAETLPEAMAMVRQGRGSVPGGKLLLVIDQFEQWLNHNRAPDGIGMLESLRQCDGGSLQALLLARDDFMVPVAEFMDRLEEPLLQNHNFATVDLFGADHAKVVLAAFGRAYGTVADPPTQEQERFLNAAVTELSANGCIVPVQLALFADMIKDRPCTPAALRGIGGARGVGVAFLEDRLVGMNAHPFFRSHAAAVRCLLAELLPSDEATIKPPARALVELKQRFQRRNTAT